MVFFISLRTKSCTRLIIISATLLLMISIAQAFTTPSPVGIVPTQCIRTELCLHNKLYHNEQEDKRKEAKQLIEETQTSDTLQGRLCTQKSSLSLSASSRVEPSRRKILLDFNTGGKETQQSLHKMNQDPSLLRNKHNDNSCIRMKETSTNFTSQEPKQGLSRSSFLKASASMAAFLTISSMSSDATTISPPLPTKSLESPPSSSLLPESITITNESKNDLQSIVDNVFTIISDSSSLSLSSSTNTNSESTLVETIAGFVSGASITVTKTLFKYPLDTASVRLQIPNTPYSTSSIQSILELFEGSFRGISSVLITNIPAGSVFFAIKDFTKSYLKTISMSADGGVLLPKWLITCIAVGVAQPPYWLVRNPSEVVKTRQQAGIDGYDQSVSAIDAFRNILNTTTDVDVDADPTNTSSYSGIKELYSGYWENIIYAYPADVLKFLCYEQLSGGRKNVAPLEGAAYGAAATAFAQFCTTPLDVVRNRIMTKTTGTTTGSYDDTSLEKVDNLNNESTIDILQRIRQEEGIKGLFAGVTPRVGKAVISGAIQFATYEETKQSIRKLFDKK